MALPLVLRRVWPVALLGWLCAVALVSALALDLPLIGDVALVIALHSVAVRSPRRTALLAAAGVEIVAVLLAVRFGDSLWWATAIYFSGLVVAALGLGLYRATRITYLAELRDRAARLELERDQQGALAAAAERARITREMHDIIAHHLTVMVALSDGAAAATGGPDPDRAVAIMRSVSATGRRALADTRRVLGVLRAPDEPADGPRQPTPDLAGVDGLVGRVRAAGLPVALRVQGAAGPVGPTAQLTVYRLVQEALTNTLKHAGVGATAEVSLRYRPDAVDVEVLDDGGDAPRSAASPAAGGPGAGRGLAGMRERVQVFGGTVDAGPRPDGGWRVRARVLLDSGPDRPGDTDGADGAEGAEGADMARRRA